MERERDLIEANRELRRSLDAATQRLTTAEQSQQSGGGELQRRNAELEAELRYACARTEKRRRRNVMSKSKLLLNLPAAVLTNGRIAEKLVVQRFLRG